MKHLLVISLLLLSLIACSDGKQNYNSSVEPDYNKGLAAVQSGDYAAALAELAPLAEQGHAKAQYNLGVMYGLGQGVLKNEVTAAKWYRLSAEQGLAPAQDNLGVMYYNGYTVPQDYKLAMEWYRRSAEQGYASGQYHLAAMYDAGDGVAQDRKIAAKWYRLSAEQGHGKAQNNLGVKYATGEGVSQDYIYAYMWGDISASSGEENGNKVRDFAARKMTPAQIVAAKALVRDCVAKNYKGC